MLEYLQRLRTHLNQFQLRINELQQQNQELTHTLNDSQRKYADALKMKDDFILQQKQDNGQLSSKFASIKEEYQQLNNDAKELTQRYDKIVSDSKELATAYAQVQSERDNLSTELSTLKQNFEQAQALIQQLKAENEHLSAKNQQGKTEIQAFIAQLAQVSSPDTNASLKEIQDLANENAQLEQELNQ